MPFPQLIKDRLYEPCVDTLVSITRMDCNFPYHCALSICGVTGYEKPQDFSEYFFLFTNEKYVL